MFDELLRLLTLQDANTRTVLLGATALGIASAVVGSFAVLRRRALVGDAVSHAALPGLCLAYLVIGDRNFAAFLAGALVMGVGAAAFIALVKAWTRVKEDAAIALVIGGFFGLGIVLSRSIQNEPSGNRAGLDGFIFGKAASMVASDAALIGAIGAGVIACVALLFKEFRVLCFDRDFASSQGWPSLLLDLLLMTLVCVCTVAGLPAVGVVLMVSLLVIPPAAARFWTNRLGTMVCLAGAFGGAAGALGTGLSATLPAPASALTRGWPTGPLITLVAAAIFVISLLAAPKRGVAADLVRRWTLRRRVARQNLLRRVYEALEPRGDFAAVWTQESIPHSSRALRSALRAGLVERTETGFRLSATGRAAAARVVRAHRLWEIYLITQAQIAPDHVDRDADQIEHVLPPETLATLEAKLAEEGRLPAGVPRSPHRIGAPVEAGALRP
ncbi:MAG: iron ABC transporter [Phycisphaerae bacterium]|nr:iron ABC transporter [Phycisphaerae bacterium]